MLTLVFSLLSSLLPLVSPLPAKIHIVAPIFGLPDSREGRPEWRRQMGVVTQPRENQSTIREEIKVLFRLILGRNGLIVS